MNKTLCLVLVGVLAMAWANPAAAVVNIQLDFGISSSPVQSGWVGVSGANRLDNGTGANLGDGMSAGILGWLFVSDRDRGAGSSGVPAADDLLRDFMEANISKVAVGAPWFEIRGLPAGSYAVTVLVGDPSFPSSPDETIVVNGVTIDLPEFVTGGTYPDSYAATTSVTLAAGETVWLGRPETGWGKVSGVIITPEPATLALLGICAAGAMIRRRR